MESVLVKINVQSLNVGQTEDASGTKKPAKQNVHVELLVQIFYVLLDQYVSTTLKNALQRVVSLHSY